MTTEALRLIPSYPIKDIFFPLFHLQSESKEMQLKAINSVLLKLFCLKSISSLFMPTDLIFALLLEINTGNDDISTK